MFERVSCVTVILGLYLTLLVCMTVAAESPPKDSDFAIQGEYSGETEQPADKQKLGAQVVALGQGKFRLVMFRGGLPGDGWDGKETSTAEGETIKALTSFQTDEFAARVEGDALIIESPQLGQVRLKKVNRRSTTLDTQPPKGAVVLFDGKHVDQFTDGRLTDDGLLRPGATSKLKFQSGTLHVDFQIPYAPLVPTRGNSGVYLQSRYEVQILDSFGFQPHNHECGGIPSVRAPDLTMSFPPLAWQTYDANFTAATFEAGKKVKPARMTVQHNGVTIHDDVEVSHATTSSPLMEGPEPGPLNLQEHGSEVRFRNIWFHPLPE